MARAKTTRTRGRGTPARPVKGAPVVAPAGRGNARIGVELDGGVAHIVSVGADGAVMYQRIEGATNVAVLGDVLRGIGKADNLRVALTSTGQSVRRLEVPNVPAHAVPMAIRSIADEHLPMGGAGIAVAGLETGVATTAGREMTVAAVNAADVSPLIRQLGGLRPLIVSAFLLPADGLYLRVARSTAELVLVRDGVPAAVRTLQIGGISELAHQAHQPDSTLYLGTDSGNGAVNAYVDDVVSDVRRTVVFWRREGMNVPDQLTVIGEGASLPALSQRLRDASYEVMPVPTPQGLNFDAVRPEDRPVAFQALAAALLDVQRQPYLALADGAAIQPAVSERTSALPKIMAGACIAAILLIVAYFAASFVMASNRLSSAQSREAAASAQLKELEPFVKLQRSVNTGKEQVNIITSTEPATAPLLRAFFDAAPPGTRVQNLSVTRGDTVMTGEVTADIPAPNEPAFQPVATWEKSFLAMQAASISQAQLDSGIKAPQRDAWPATLTKPDDDPNVINARFSFTMSPDAFKPAPAQAGGTK